MEKRTRGGIILFRHEDTGEDLCTAFMSSVPSKPDVVELGPVDGTLVVYDVKKVKYELLHPPDSTGVPHCQHTPVVYIKEPV